MKLNTGIAILVGLNVEAQKTLLEIICVDG